MLNHLTIVVPVRIDAPERMENLQAMLRWMSAWNIPAIVLEGDSKPRLSEEKLRQWSPMVKYVFYEDLSSVFHRTYYINRLIQMVQTTLVGVWDSDVIVSHIGVSEAYRQVLNNPFTIAYPYDGRFIMHSPHTSNLFRERIDLEVFEGENSSCIGRPSCGGAYVIHRDAYWSIGGENERFVGWGLEDAERLHRCQILGWQIYRSGKSALHHLYHPCISIKEPSFEDRLRAMREEFLLECALSSSQLKEYIQQTYTWVT